MEAYGHAIEDKNEIVVLSKCDAVDAETLKTQTARLKRASGMTPLKLSAAAGQGVEALLREVMHVIETERDAEQALENPVVAEAWHP